MDDDYIEREEPDEPEEREDGDEEEYICGWCNGSGEGLYDGSSCHHCKGSGVEK